MVIFCLSAIILVKEFGKGGDSMKLTYKAQMGISVMIIIFANILTDVLENWIYRSIGFAVCGLLFIVHPVVPEGMAVNQKTIFWTRTAGVILILIGVFTRVHHF